MRQLTDAILADMERRHGIPHRTAGTPERAKALRQALIKKKENEDDPVPEGDLHKLQQDMEDIFFVMQLYSYPGNYLSPNAPIERLAETIDKFEEDILGRDLPAVRGRRRVVIRFGAPIPAAGHDGKRPSSAELSQRLHASVQWLIDEINAQE